MRRVPTVLVALLVLAAAPRALAENPVPATVTTGAATNVGLTTATATGTVDPNGTATTYRVEYGTSTAYGLTSGERSAGSGDAAIAISVALSGLTAGTTYHFRVVATNAAGVARGADRTLRTTAPASRRPPAVTTGAIAELAPRGVTLTGAVNPRGLATTYRFEYGVGSKLDRRTSARGVGAGSATVAVQRRLRLTPATRYTYRIVATNAAGTARGARRSFRAPAEVLGIDLEPSATRVVYGDGVQVTGRLRGAGTRTVPVALELQRFPYDGPFAQVGDVRRSGSDGTVRFTLPTLVVSSRLRLVTRTGIVATSRARTVRTAVRPGLRVRRLRGGRLRFSGTVRPAVAGARVSLQRRRRGRFVTLRRTRLTAARYRLTIGGRRRGAVYRVVVVPPRRSGHVRNGSRELYVRGVGP